MTTLKQIEIILKAQNQTPQINHTNYRNQWSNHSCIDCFQTHYNQKRKNKAFNEYKVDEGYFSSFVRQFKSNSH